LCGLFGDWCYVLVRIYHQLPRNKDVRNLRAMPPAAAFATGLRQRLSTIDRRDTMGTIMDDLPIFAQRRRQSRDVIALESESAALECGAEIHTLLQITGILIAHRQSPLAIHFFPPISDGHELQLFSIPELIILRPETRMQDRFRPRWRCEDDAEIASGGMSDVQVEHNGFRNHVPLARHNCEGHDWSAVVRYGNIRLD